MDGRGSIYETNNTLLVQWKFRPDSMVIIIWNFWRTCIIWIISMIFHWKHCGHTGSSMTEHPHILLAVLDSIWMCTLLGVALDWTRQSNSCVARQISGPNTHFHVWDTLKEKVNSKPVASSEDLLQRIQEEADAMRATPDNLNREIRSRLNICLEKNGGHFENKL